MYTYMCSVAHQHHLAQTRRRQPAASCRDDAPAQACVAREAGRGGGGADAGMVPLVDAEEAGLSANWRKNKNSIAPLVAADEADLRLSIIMVGRHDNTQYCQVP